MKLLESILLLLLINAIKGADIRYGTYIGPLSKLAHDVEGEVYVVDSSTLRIRHFYYDGMGPDAFFYVGVRDVSPADVSGDGVRLMDENGRSEKLSGYSNADVILSLPSGTTVDQLMWFSVWCYNVEVNFGSIMFPSSFTIPTVQMLGTFQTIAHGVSSGMVKALNSREIYIENFMYDGEGPDTFFWIGMGTPDSNGTQIADEMGSMDLLEAYTGQNITIMLPRTKTIHDIDYISVWCEEFAVNFGHVSVADNLEVIPYTADLGEYRGKLVGDLITNAHGVEGTVYLVDDNHIRLTNFNYDGQGPDAYFWMGVTSTVSTNGVIIPNEFGMTSVLGAYHEADIVLQLPPGSLDTARWLSVWCRNFTVNFGHIYFPGMMNPPAAVALPPFTELAHQVRSGTVTLLDTRRVRIENLYYDGLGPDAFFWIGKGTPDTDGWAIPDENGSTMKLDEYQGETIVLTLPEGYTFHDIDYLSMWCKLARQDFGHVMIPSGLLLPPYFEATNMMEPLGNCQKMHKHFNVAWEIEDDYIKFEFVGALEADNRGYMAFGLSGSTSRSSMIGGDVMVAYFSSADNSVHVVDYTLTQYAQCSGGVGACPDTEANGDNMDNIEDVEGYHMDGVTTVRFKRALNTGDGADLVIPETGNTYVIWAMGRLSDDDYVTRHNLRLDGNLQLDFGRSSMSINCSTVVSRTPPVTAQPWMRSTQDGGYDRMFRATIGPAGPEQYGYFAITDQQSWGIAWYINGHLIPELTVVRGLEYTFIIEGGDNTTNLARYHPFYITNDKTGGYARKSAGDKALVDVYAGVNPTTGAATGVGRYCEYMVGANSASLTDYDDYINSLTLQCMNGTAGMFKWTPNDDTPDLVYYQCYTHRYLGWKIRVVDDLIVSGGTTTRFETAVILLAIALLSLIFY